ncbi:MAG: hypothetical protein IPL52_03105 [Flavobacteriales bacterium]|nr:hypothetical protein [Flavobacteriales bacterium]
MRWLARSLVVLYMLSLVVGLGYWWYIWQMHDGMPPQDEALGRWASVNPWAFDFSFNLVAVQVTYPVFLVVYARNDVDRCMASAANDPRHCRRVGHRLVPHPASGHTGRERLQELRRHLFQFDR